MAGVQLRRVPAAVGGCVEGTPGGLGWDEHQGLTRGLSHRTSWMLLFRERGVEDGEST